MPEKKLAQVSENFPGYNFNGDTFTIYVQCDDMESPALNISILNI